MERLAGLALPRLRLVEPRRPHELDLVRLAQMLDGRAQHREPVPEIGAEAQVDAGHQCSRTISTAGVPTRPPSGGVSLRTRTRIRETAKSRRSASATSAARRSSRFTRFLVPT